MYNHQRGGAMKTLFVGILVGFASLAFAQEKDVALTVYSNNLALVREVRTIQLPRGTSEVRFTDVAASIDPTSVHFTSLTDAGDVDLIEQNYEYDLLSPNKMLQNTSIRKSPSIPNRAAPFRGGC